MHQIPYFFFLFQLIAQKHRKSILRPACGVCSTQMLVKIYKNTPSHLFINELWGHGTLSAIWNKMEIRGAQIISARKVDTKVSTFLSKAKKLTRLKPFKTSFEQWIFCVALEPVNNVFKTGSKTVFKRVFGPKISQNGK